MKFENLGRKLDGLVASCAEKSPTKKIKGFVSLWKENMEERKEIRELSKAVIQALKEEKALKSLGK